LDLPKENINGNRGGGEDRLAKMKPIPETNDFSWPKSVAGCDQNRNDRN